MNNKMFSVIKREFTTRVRTKGFIIGTAIFPVLIFLLLAIPIFLSTMETEKRQTFAIIDLTGRVYAPLTKILNDTTEQGAPLYSFQKIDVKSGDDLSDLKNQLSKQVLEGQINGYIVIPEDVIESDNASFKNLVEFYAKNVSNFQLNRTIDQSITTVVRSIRLEDSGLDPSTINKLTRGVYLKTYKVSAKGEKEDQGFTFGITYFLVMILYMVLILYGAMITRSVVEEKNTRVVEMIVSSVRPFQLMTGKIFGIGAVGLLQFFIWAGFMLLISSYRMQLAQLIGSDVPGIIQSLVLPLDVIVFFIVFFILGFLFFATMYAAVGAMVNSDQEAQQMQMPLIMFLIVPILIMMYVISNPDSTVAVVLSMIPFFSPIIMFMRVSVLMPPVWEVGLSILILIASILIMIWLAGKIYRVGILMYGKRPNFVELVKWVKYS